MKKGFLLSLILCFCSLVHTQSVLNGIVINEILVDPNSSTDNFDTDMDGSADSDDEFIELYNTTNSTVDISGWQLWDFSSKPNSPWFTFPGAVNSGTTTITANSYVVVVADYSGSDPCFFSGGYTPIVIMNNGGDNIVLYDPNSDNYIQARYNGDPEDDASTFPNFPATATQIGSTEHFGNDIDGNALGRVPDGSTNFVSGTGGIATPCASNNSLPVELLFLKGIEANGQIILSWQTASEENNSHFEVQRSEYGKDFTTIGEEEGNGTTVEIQDYEFVDALPLNGLNYYRLRQVDFDGNYEYSDIISITMQEGARRISVYPNPVKDILNINLLSESEFTIEIFDNIGRPLRQIKSTNITNERLDVTNLADGQYILKINGFSFNQALMFTKMK